MFVRPEPIFIIRVLQMQNFGEKLDLLEIDQGVQVKLLYRADKFPDECFPDYLARLSCWNGFKDSADFMRFLSKIYNNLHPDDCQEKNPDPDSKEFEARYPFYIRWYKCRIALEFIIRRSLVYSELNLDAYRVSQPNKVCVGCWGENPYRKFYWRYQEYKICHKHNVRLVVVDNILYNSPTLTGTTEYVATLDRRSISCSYVSAILRNNPLKTFNFENLQRENYIIELEITLWKRVIRFLNERFSFSFVSMDIFDFVTLESIAGLAISNRLEKMTEKLIGCKTEFSLFIKTAVLVCIQRSYLMYYPDVKSWVLSEAYFINPVFYSYLYGINQHFFIKDELTFADEISQKNAFRRVNLSRVSDRILCKFILESRILSDSQLESISRNGRIVIGTTELPGHIDQQRVDYEKFIEMTGDCLFDRQPINR